MSVSPEYEVKENHSLLAAEAGYLDKFEDTPLSEPQIGRRRPLTRIAQRCTSIASSTCRNFSILDILRHILYSLIPTFLRKTQSGSSQSTQTKRRTSKYAHLDGLRGLAALFVFFFHSSYTVWNVRPGYNSTPEYTSIMRLPILKLLFAGDAMVSIFFVVSGFVLSLKPISLMRAGAYENLLKSVSSAGFRRGIRLYVPCFASTFIVMLVIRMGIFEHTRDFANNNDLLQGAGEFHMLHFDTFSGQFWNWCKQSLNFIHVWDWDNIYDANTGYDIHLWTIPDEFRCSLLLYLTHVVIGPASSRGRFGLLCFLVAFAVFWGRWDMMCFWAGAILVELDTSSSSSTPQEGLLDIKPEHRSRWKGQGRKTAWLILFFIGLYLLSFPDQRPQTTYGYQTLWNLVPRSFGQSNRFWQAIGAFITAFCINNLEILQSVFTCAPIKYLGNISFSLYLMHGLVIHTVGYTLLPLMWSITTRATDFHIVLGWLMSQSIVIVVVIYLADIFWVNVEMPSNTLCHWLEGFVFGKRS